MLLHLRLNPLQYNAFAMHTIIIRTLGRNQPVWNKQVTCKTGKVISLMQVQTQGRRQGKGRYHLLDSLQAISWKDNKAQGLNQRSDLFVSHSKVALGTSNADGISPALHSAGGLRPFNTPLPFWLTLQLFFPHTGNICVWVGNGVIMPTAMQVTGCSKMR